MSNSYLQKLIKIYITGAIIALALSLVSLLSVLFYFDPYKSPAVVILFYALIWLGSFSLFFMAVFYLRCFFGQRELANKYLKVSLRQGLFIAFLLIAFLFLYSSGLYSWWNGLLLVLALTFLELYFLVK